MAPRTRIDIVYHGVLTICDHGESHPPPQPIRGSWPSEGEGTEGRQRGARSTANDL